MNKALHVFQVLFVAWDADHDRFAIAAGAACTANAVNIVFGMARHVKVEHVADRRHIKPTGRNIRSDKEFEVTSTETVEGSCALALIQIAVDGGGVIAGLFQGLCNRIYVHLPVTEDDCVRAFVPFGIDQRAQNFVFFRRFAVFARSFEHQYPLGDVLGGGGLTGHLDPLWVAEKCVGDSLDLGRHSGGEEQRLAREGCEAKDTLDIGDEPHVEHAVSFVHNHHFDVCEDQFAALMVVKQATRRSNQNIHTFVDQLVLFFERDAANQQCFCQLGIFGVGVEILGDLSGKFARGAEHQRARHARTGTATGQHGDHGHCECSRLTSAGLRDAQNVTPCEGGGNGACLNRCRRVVTRLFNRFQDLGVQA